MKDLAFKIIQKIGISPMEADGSETIPFDGAKATALAIVQMLIEASIHQDNGLIWELYSEIKNKTIS